LGWVSWFESVATKKWGATNDEREPRVDTEKEEGNLDKTDLQERSKKSYKAHAIQARGGGAMGVFEKGGREEMRFSIGITETNSFNKKIL